MTAPATVLAEAFVLSRDGRSILDRDEHGTEPVKAFTPDPDRLRAAVGALDEHGFTVEGIEDATIEFAGSPEAFAETFGRTLRYADPTGADPGHPTWLVAGGTPAGSFAVGPGGPLGGVLHTVLLRQDTGVPAARVIAYHELFTPAAARNPVIVGQDLLLGEIGKTLATARPDWLRSRSFPAANRDEAARLTGTALREWASETLRDDLSDHIVQVRKAGARAVRAVLVERAAPAAMMDVLGTLRPTTAENPGQSWSRPPTFDGTPPRPAQGVWARGQAEISYTYFADTLMPEWNKLAGALEVYVTRQDQDLAGGTATPALKSMAREVRGRTTALLTMIAGFRLRAPHAVDQTFTDASAGLLAHWLGAVDRRLVGDEPVDAVAKVWTKTGELYGQLFDWLDQREDVYLALMRVVQQEWDRHAAMVGSAFLAVTLDDVDLTLLQAHRQSREFWGRRFPGGRRTVICGSFGAFSNGDLSAGTIAGRRASAAFRLHVPCRVESTLHVLSSGNAQTDAAIDSPNLEAVFAADAPNVLVVGGCAPDAAGRWLGAGDTHGYEFTAAAGGSARTVRIPHVCATTMGETGGAVAFPGPDARWWTGAGSSLSAPIVAAVCALVWTAFPHLSAPEVKSAVLAAAPLLDDGGFHLPTVGRTGVDPLPNAAKGVPRVSLKAALVAACGVDPVLDTRLTSMLVGAAATGGSS